jgi:hypothetical protein
VGKLEGDFFEPEKWKPEYPLPPFERMLLEDALWAAKIIQRFSDEMIRSVVETGRLENPEAENYLVETLIQRRDKILDHYFGLVNPLARFSVSKDRRTLRFENLGVTEGLADRASYQYQWFRFENEKEILEPIDEPRTATVPSITVPKDSSSYLMVRIRTSASQRPRWWKEVDVYFRNRSACIVGIER